MTPNFLSRKEIDKDEFKTGFRTTVMKYFVIMLKESAIQEYTRVSLPGIFFFFEIQINVAIHIKADVSK